MITLLEGIVLLSFVTALLAVAGIGRNTAHGFGKNVENVGDKIQRGTD
jgi:predicted small secreted protein